MRPRIQRAAALWLGCLLCAAFVVVAQSSDDFIVLSVEDDGGRISQGEGQPLGVGERLSVERAGAVIAEIEISQAGDAGARYRVLNLFAEIRTGDLAVRRPGARPPASDPPAVAPEVPALDEPEPETTEAAPAETAPDETESVETKPVETPVRESSAPQPATPQPGAPQPGAPQPAAPQPAAAEEVSEPAPPAAVADSGDDSILRISQVAGDQVFLDGGRRAGLEAGQRVQVLRDDQAIALLEIEFIASSSASCKVVEMSQAVQEGDLVIPLERVTAQTAKAPVAVITPRRQPARTRASRTPEPTPWADLRGSVSVRFQRFEDTGDAPRVLDQTTLRVNLAMREIGGSDYELRIRARGRQDDETRPGRPGENERNDRLYEAALIYDPDDSNYEFRLGRLSSGPLIGFDFLDGIEGEYRFTRRMGVGGFYGTRSDIEEFSFSGPVTSYGGFFHFDDRERGRPFYGEFLIGAVGEYEGSEVSREYLSIYGRQGRGSRWSLYQRGEIDFNRDWRSDTSEDSYQISNLLLSASYKFADPFRVSLTYDQRRRFRTLEDRDTPEERFDDLLRDGYRLTVYLGPPRGLRFTGSAGLRRREGSSEDNTTYNGSLFHSNVGGWGLLLAADFSSFSGDTSSGDRAGIRARKYLKGGHDVGLTLGASTTQLLTIGTEAQDEWIRLSGTLQLPLRFFALGEYELNQGDTFEGSRFFAQIGYRF